MSRSSLLLALLLPAVYGCDPGDACEVAATVEPGLRVGAGDKAVVPVRDGDHLEVEWGMQGGRHIWVGVRAEGVATGKQGVFSADEPGPDVTWTLLDADGLEIGSGGSFGWPLQGDETGAEIAGEELYIEWWSDDTGGPDLSSLLLRAELVDRCGTALIDEVTVTADL